MRARLIIRSGCALLLTLGIVFPASAGTCDLPAPHRYVDSITYDREPALYRNSAVLAWNGSGFAVVADVDRLFASSTGLQFWKLGARGEALAPAVFLADIGYTNRDALVWNGMGYGLLWLDLPTTGAATLSILDADGARVVDDVAVSPSAGHGAVGWDGEAFAVVWPDNGTLHFARIKPDGTPAGAERVLPFDNAAAPVIVWDGTHFGLAWHAADPSGASQVWFALLDGEGDPVAGPATNGVDAGDTFARIGLTRGPDRFAVTWGRQAPPEGTTVGLLARREFWVGFFTADGEPDGARRLGTASGVEPDIAYSGGVYGVAWQDYRSPQTGVSFRTLDLDGTPAGEPQPIEYAFYTSVRSSSIVATDSGFAAAWIETDRATPGPEFDTEDSYLAVELLGCDCADADGDGASCNDCDDQDAAVYPGAYPTCDGKNNDCRHPDWPGLDGRESDTDGDGYAPCGGDCNDASAAIHPGSIESCNGFDDDCDGAIDEDADCPGVLVEPFAFLTSLFAVDDGGPNTVEWAGAEFLLAGPVPAPADESAHARGFPYLTPPDLGLWKLDHEGFLLDFDTVFPDCEEQSFRELHSVWNGDELSLLWGCSYPSKAQYSTIDPDSLELTRDQFALSRGGGPRVWAESEYGMVSWGVERESNFITSAFLWFGRFDVEGRLLAPMVLVNERDGAEGNPNRVAPIWTGEEYIVFWTDTALDLFMARIDRDGRRIGGEIRLTDTPDRYEQNAYQGDSAHWNGSNIALCWSEQDGDTFDFTLEFGLVDPVAGGFVKPPLTVSDDPFGCEILWTGTEYTIVYYPSEGDIMFQRVDAEGQNLIGEPTVVASGRVASAKWSGNRAGVVTIVEPDDQHRFLIVAGNCADDEVCRNGIDDDCDRLVDGLDPDCPLLIVLESFTATTTDEGVALSWTTASEVDNVGFRILRQVGDTEPVAISGRIPAAGSEVLGATYAWTDTSRQDASNVVYWLEDLDLSGTATLHGPVGVAPAARGEPDRRLGLYSPGTGPRVFFRTARAYATTGTITSTAVAARIAT